VTVAVSHSAARHRVWQWASLVLLVVALASCSTSATKTTTSTRPSIPNLKAVLLTARELPPGYSAVPLDDSGIPPCEFEHVLTRGAVDRVQSVFGSATDAQFFSELLVGQPADRVATAYSKSVERLRSCHSFDTGTNGLGKMTGRVFAFPSVGEASAGFRFVVTAGIEVPQYLVVARFGNTVAAFNGIGGTASQFERLVKKASVKMTRASV
jgi:hypothetical protein